jgi:hypothetical protein
MYKSLPVEGSEAVDCIKTELSRLEQLSRSISYMKLFQEIEMSEMFVFNCDNEEHSSVMRTFMLWKIVITKMEDYESFERAIQILNLIAFFEPTGIPIDVFLHLELECIKEVACENKPIKSETSSAVVLEHQLLSAVSLLKQFSLISVNDQKREISVDLKVQRLTQLQPESKVQEILSQGLNLFQKHFKVEFRETELTKCILSHARALWKFELTKNRSPANKFMFSSFPSYICETLIYWGEYKSALQVAEESEESLQNLLTRDKDVMLRLRYNKCSALHGLSKYPESLRLSRENYEICVKVHGESHSISSKLADLIDLNLTELGAAIDSN